MTTRKRQTPGAKPAAAKAAPKPKPKEPELDVIAQAAQVLAEMGNPVVTLRDGTDVGINKCKAKNVGTILSMVSFVMQEMGIKSLGDMPSMDASNPTFFLQLIAKGSDRVFAAAAELCTLDYEQISELELDEALKIVMEVFQLNKAFFFHSVLPLVPFASLGSQESPKISE